MGNEVVIGIDLGGTNIVIGIFNRHGELLGRHTSHTGVDGSSFTVINNMVDGMQKCLQKHSLVLSDLVGVAVGSPGFLNRKEGMIYLAPNLKWRDFPLQKVLEERLECPVILENDANAAIYGEFRKGCAREFSSAIGFTLGTGIGGGIVIENRLVHGCFDMAGELGHMTLDPQGPLCGCGNHGCLEAFASASGVKKYLQEQYPHYKDSLIYSLVDDNLDKVSPVDVYQAALQNDSFAVSVFQRVGKYLGIAAANIINIFNPPVVFFNGGMTNAGDYIMNPLLAESQQRTITASYEKTTIRFGELGSDAGLMGIGALAVEAFFC